MLEVPCKSHCLICQLHRLTQAKQLDCALAAILGAKKLKKRTEEVVDLLTHGNHYRWFPQCWDLPWKMECLWPKKHGLLESTSDNWCSWLLLLVDYEELKQQNEVVTKRYTKNHGAFALKLFAPTIMAVGRESAACSCLSPWSLLSRLTIVTTRNCES